jgi:hypothetical protein
MVKKTFEDKQGMLIIVHLLRKIENGTRANTCTSR